MKSKPEIRIDALEMLLHFQAAELDACKDILLDLVAGKDAKMRSDFSDNFDRIVEEHLRYRLAHVSDTKPEFSHYALLAWEALKKDGKENS
jgi:hypothetical protein